MTGEHGGSRKLALAAVLAAVLLTLGLTACGGDGSTSAPPSVATDSQGQGAAKSEAGGEPGSPSAEFEVAGGDNSVQRFGKEAGKAELEAASTVVESYMAAVEGEDFPTQCAQLARDTIGPLERIADPDSQEGGSGSGCARALSQLRAGTPGATVGAMAGPVASLRVQGAQAFALYHGKGGVDYVLPLKRESDGWKVASLVPVEL